LDYLSVRCYAPGQSAFNVVERAMSSFSSRLAGVVLPFDYHGNHLSSDKTRVTDVELAKRNMEYAAEQLNGYWTKDFYCKKPVYFQYVKPDENSDVNTRFEWLNHAMEEMKDSLGETDAEEFSWLERHALFAKYSIDFKKCADRNCCKPIVDVQFADLLKPFNGFLPPVVPTKSGQYCGVLQLLEFPPLDKTAFKTPDIFTPSIQKTEYVDYVCSTCGVYYPVKKLLVEHRKISR
jgi:hypothetical protein